MQLTISSKGWVVIPAELRKKYGLKPGDAVVVVDYGGVLALVPALKDPIREAMGMMKSDDSLAKALVEERRNELEEEDRTGDCR